MIEIIGAVPIRTLCPDRTHPRGPAIQDSMASQPQAEMVDEGAALCHRMIHHRFRWYWLRRSSGMGGGHGVGLRAVAFV